MGETKCYFIIPKDEQRQTPFPTPSPAQGGTFRFHPSTVPRPTLTRTKNRATPINDRKVVRSHERHWDPITKGNTLRAGNPKISERRDECGVSGAETVSLVPTQDTAADGEGVTSRALGLLISLWPQC